MRNLKKVLSLALALVMLLGMMVVGAGAATKFQDDDKIQNKEAVAVLVGLGVMKGREDGSNFEPNGTLTRAEAAKMIAQLDLGVEAADALKANGNNTFSDVWTDHWAAGPIDYCVEQGYIKGDGAGHFFPSRNVTGVQFASMLLRLLGYDAEIEELVGDQWAVKAAALARKAGLTTKVLANNEDMTRDGMAQMAFNALTAPMVEYKGMNITVGDATFKSPATVRLHDTTLLGTNRTYDGKVITATTPIRLCEERFPYLKLRTTEEDNFGHTASVWKYREAEIVGSKTTVAADIELTSKVEKTLPEWLKIKELTKNTGAKLFINGDTSTAVPADGDGIRALTHNGRRVEIYLSEADLTKFDKIVITDTALAEVTKVVDSDETISVKLLPNKAVNIASDNTYSYTNDDVVAATNVVLNTKVGYGDVKKGDLVLVQGYSTSDPKLNEDTTVTSVEQATEVKGFATHKAYSNQVKATYIQIDGEKYYDAYGVMKEFGTIDFNLNTKFDSTLYLDQYGYIMKAIQGEDPNLTTDNLIAVKDGYRTLTDGKIVEMVEGVLSNGQTVNWALSDDSAAATKNTIMTYEKKNNGTYQLKAISADKTLSVEDAKANKTNTYVVDYGNTGGNISFKSNDVYGKKNGENFMYSDTVKFIFVDGTEGVTVVNGRQTYDFTRTAASIVAQALKNGEITAVFVNGKADVANLEDVIFVSSRYRAWDEVITRENGQKVQYYGYTAYTASGEKIDHFLGVNETMANNFYVADKNADGAYKANHPDMLNNHSMVSGALQVANGLSGDAFVLKKGTTPFEFVGRKSTVVKDLSDAKLYIESVAELNAAVNNGYNVTVAVLYNKTDSPVHTSGADPFVKEAVTVFVTEAKKGSTPVTPTTPEGALGVDIDPYNGMIDVNYLHGEDVPNVAKEAEEALIASGYTITAKDPASRKITATKNGVSTIFTYGASATEYFSVKVDDKTYYVKADGMEKDGTAVLNLPLNKDATGFAGTGTGYVIDGTNPVYKAYSTGDINATSADVAGNGTNVTSNVVIKTGYVYVTEDGGTTKKPVAVDGTYTTSAKGAGDNGTGFKMTVNAVDSYVKYGAEIAVTNKDVTLAKDHVKRTDVALNGDETVTPVAYAASATAIAKPTAPAAGTGKGTGYLVTKGADKEYNAYASDSGTLFPDADFTVECGYVKVTTPNVDAFATNAVVSYTVAGEPVAKNTTAAYAKASDGKTVVVTLALTGGDGIKTNAASGNTIELGISSTVEVTGTNTGNGAAPTTSDKTVTFEAATGKTYKGLTITFTVPVAEADITATNLGLTGTNLVAAP